MTAKTLALAPPIVLTDAEWRTLPVLRAHYRQHRDILSSRELARLRFVRWLYQTGRLVP